MVASGIRRVSIIDDDPNERSFLVDEFEGRFTPVTWAGPYETIAELVDQVVATSDAVTCDHHLVKNYARERGAAFVADFYSRKFPAVLRTKYGKAELHEIRRYRNRIPVLLTPDDIDPESFEKAWAICEQEFSGRFLPSREPWRTLIRVENVERPNFVDVVIPAWNHREVVRLLIDLLPNDARPRLAEGLRFHAKVNLGTESQDDLYFADFEFAG